ncbi:MAG: ABC transporter permease subunit [Micromonosporaceae bacterium]
MRLLRAELARLTARRFTRVMFVALLLALGTVAIVVAYNTSRPTAEDLRRAEAQAAEERTECLAAQEHVPEREQWDCGEITAAHYLDYVLNFRAEMPDLMLGFGGMLALFGFLVGASYIGAEWSSGGIANLLLWRTRRVRVLVAKLTAMLLTLLVAGIVVAAAWVAAIWFIASTRGLIGELTPGFWNSLGFDAARAIGLALLTSVVGMAVASLGRRTAAALGLLIGYLVVWELGARLVMEGLDVLAPDRFMLSSYVAGWLAKETTITDYQDCYAMDCTPYELLVTWPSALLVLGTVAVTAVVVASWSFQRRDVT